MNITSEWVILDHAPAFVVTGTSDTLNITVDENRLMKVIVAGSNDTPLHMDSIYAVLNSIDTDVVEVLDVWDMEYKLKEGILAGVHLSTILIDGSLRDWDLSCNERGIYWRCCLSEAGASIGKVIEVRVSINLYPSRPLERQWCDMRRGVYLNVHSNNTHMTLAGIKVPEGVISNQTIKDFMISDEYVQYIVNDQ
jgi:hypothetical protein